MVGKRSEIPAKNRQGVFRDSLLQRLRPLIVYSVLALLIVLPLLKPGYVFGLDMIFTPELAMPSIMSHSYLFYAFLHVLNLVLPAALIQKMLLFGVLLIAGLMMHRLLQYVQPPTTKVTRWHTVVYFGGVLYVCNPFTYTRFIVGQYEVLLGYALLPLFILLIWKFFDRPSLKKALQAALAILAISIVSIHTLGIAILTGGILLVRYIWPRQRQREWLKKIGLYLVAMVAVVSVASSYWLIPLTRGEGITSKSIASFTGSDMEAFQTSPGEIGPMGNALALQGFWGDEHNLYLLPSDVFSWWWLPIAVLWLLIIAGAVWAWRHQKGAGLFFGSLLAVGLILALGTADTFAAPINGWLHNHVAFFAGYREPQKFAMLIALSYAYFGTIGLYALTGCLRKIDYRKVTAASLLLPVACAPLFVWGCAGQLQTNDYPKGWYILNEKLRGLNAQDDKTLFLPWHLYMPYHFSDGVIASPSAKFFTSTTVLFSRNPELKNAHGYTTDTDIQTLDRHILLDAERNEDLADDLAALGIRYIIVSKDFDFKAYKYLDNKRGIQTFVDNADVKAYTIKGEKSET